MSVSIDTVNKDFLYPDFSISKLPFYYKFPYFTQKSKTLSLAETQRKAMKKEKRFEQNTKI